MHSSDATTNTPHPPQAWPVRVLLVLIAAFAFGLLAAMIAGPDTDGLSALSRLRGNLADVSAPWLMVAFIAGRLTRRPGWGALMGFLATMCALLGFYLWTSLVVDLGGHGMLDNLGRELRANRLYLMSGVVSGPLFGALGGLRQSTRLLNVGVFAGIALLGEPIVLGVIGILRPATMVGRDATSIAVTVAELGLGLVVLLVSMARPSRQPQGYNQRMTGKEPSAHDPSS